MYIKLKREKELLKSSYLYLKLEGSQTRQIKRHPVVKVLSFYVMCDHNLINNKKWYVK